MRVSQLISFLSGVASRNVTWALFLKVVNSESFTPISIILCSAISAKLIGLFILSLYVIMENVETIHRNAIRSMLLQVPSHWDEAGAGY